MSRNERENDEETKMEEIRRKLRIHEKARGRIEEFISKVANLLYYSAILCHTLDNVQSLKLFKKPKSRAYKQAKKDIESSITSLNSEMSSISFFLFGGKYPPLLGEAKRFLEEVDIKQKEKSFLPALRACWTMRKVIYEFATTDFDTYEYRMKKK
jgi:hypothetical protein